MIKELKLTYNFYLIKNPIIKNVKLINLWREDPL